MYDIITIGSATKDVFLLSKGFKLVRSKQFKSGVGECFDYGSKVELGDIYFDTGGGATNAAFTFANLGLKTSVVSKVGHDICGAEILHQLAEKNINTSNLSVANDLQTAYSTILITPGGDRTALVYRGASADFSASDFRWQNLKTKWFYISSLGGDLALHNKIWAFAKKNKIKIAWNPGSQELKLGKSKLSKLLEQVNIFNLNKDESQKLTGKKEINKILTDLSKLNKNYNLVTSGEKGAYLSDGLAIYFLRSLPAKPVNTTGAGDAFGSAFCAGMILKSDWDFALRLANLNANGVIQQMGAKHGLLKKMPSKKDLDKNKIDIYGKISC